MPIDIDSFAEQFLTKLSSYPVRYDAGYNASQSRSKLKNKKKVQIGIVEITLKNLRSSASIKTKLSRTEPTIHKLQKEASALLGCQLESVVLIQNGQVLQDTQASIVVSNAASPVYVFDRREWSQKGIYGEEFREDFIQLLRRYGVDNPEYLAQQFILNSTSWMKSK